MLYEYVYYKGGEVEGEGEGVEISLIFLKKGFRFDENLRVGLM